MQSQSSLDRWFSDFEVCTRLLRNGAVTVDLLSLVIPAAAGDDAHNARCDRLLKAYRYLLLNVPAFEILGEISRRDDGTVEASTGLTYALYLFFGSDVYGNHPPLELVIDAALRVTDGTDARGC